MPRSREREKRHARAGEKRANVKKNTYSVKISYSIISYRIVAYAGTHRTSLRSTAWTGARETFRPERQQTTCKRAKDVRRRRMRRTGRGTG